MSRSLYWRAVPERHSKMFKRVIGWRNIALYLWLRTEYEKRWVRNSLSFAVICRGITNLSAVATGFIALHLYSHYLTKELYGAVLVAVQLLTYLPLISGGFGMVLSQKMLSSRDPEVVAKNARFNQILQCHILVVALVVAMVLMVIYSQTATARSMGLPIWLYLLVGFGGVVSFYAGGQFGMLTGLGHQIYTIVLTGIWGVTTVIVLWVGFLCGLGVWAMPISTTFGAGLLLPAAWILQRRFVHDLPILSWRRDSDFWPRLKAIWIPSLTYLMCQFSIMCLFTMDIIFMGILFGPAAAALYGVISRVTAMSRQIIQTLCDTAWPKLTQEPDLQRRAALMRKVDRLNAWMAGSWHGALLATLQPFLGWLMKTDWVAGPTLIWLMVARNLVEVLSAPHSYGLLSEGRFKDIARNAQIEIAVCICAILLFSHYLGVNGFALGILVGTAGGALWYTTYLYFKVASHTTWFSEWCAVYARGLTSAAIGFGVASLAWLGVKSLLHAPGWVAIFAGGFGFAAGMAVAILFGLAQGGGTNSAINRWIKLPNKW